MNSTRIATKEFIRAAYRVLLMREPESEEVVDALAARALPTEEIAAGIMTSPEFLSGPLVSRIDSARTQTFSPINESLDKLCRAFGKYEGPGEPGFCIDFLGVRTRVNYSAPFAGFDAVVLDYPSRQVRSLYGAEEWEGTLRSVLEARDQFVAIELGAGWGPWLVTSAVAAAQRGIRDIKLAGIEGSEAHFEYLRQHFIDNSIDPDAHFLFHGVVGTTDGFAYFPKLPDPASDWGAQAVSDPIPAGGTDGGFVDYRGVRFEAFDKVPCLALSSLLQQYERVDLVHCDIQDSEREVIPAAFSEIDKRVRRLVTGTHSRASEAALLEVFAKAGWILEAEVSCKYQVMDHRVVLTNDGVQTWANPRLSAS